MTVLAITYSGWRWLRSPSIDLADGAVLHDWSLASTVAWLVGFVALRTTGLTLTVARLLAIGGGLLVGVLVYLVRSNGHLAGVDPEEALQRERCSVARGCSPNRLR